MRLRRNSLYGLSGMREPGRSSGRHAVTGAVSAGHPAFRIPEPKPFNEEVVVNPILVGKGRMLAPGSKASFTIRILISVKQRLRKALRQPLLFCINR